jgi:hypothetical protein
VQPLPEENSSPAIHITEVQLVAHVRYVNNVSQDRSRSRTRYIENDVFFKINRWLRSSLYNSFTKQCLEGVLQDKVLLVFGLVWFSIESYVHKYYIKICRSVAFLWVSRLGKIRKSSEWVDRAVVQMDKMTCSTFNSRSICQLSKLKQYEVFSVSVYNYRWNECCYIYIIDESVTVFLCNTPTQWLVTDIPWNAESKTINIRS